MVEELGEEVLHILGVVVEVETSDTGLYEIGRGDDRGGGEEILPVEFEESILERILLFGLRVAES